MNTYDPNGLKPNDKPKMKTWKKAILTVCAVIAVIVVFNVIANKSGMLLLSGDNNDYRYSSDYIGSLSLEGTISEDGSPSEEYNQSWILERINAMENDRLNKGIILRINTPGGSVYATDEVYLKLEEYKKNTGRPVYVYMESQATSGGYYIASNCDKIYANRNCWTGSIGVTIGTIYDISGFLEKLGVKTVTITSGKNKAMGSSVDPMTKEQKAIFQGLVDDSYEQFVKIVATGRKMKIAEVKKIADGRIYTARQAKENGLIDEIGTFDEAVADMSKAYELESCDIQEITYEPKTSILSLLTGKTENNSSSVQSEYDQLLRLMNSGCKFSVTYLSYIQK